MRNLKSLSVVAMCAAAVAGCATSRPVTQTLENNALIKYLNGKGYTNWPVPATLQSAGALIEFDDGVPVIKGDLLSCAADSETRNDLFKAMFGPDQETQDRYRNAQFPDFDFERNSNLDFGLDFALKILGGSANYENVRKATITTTNSGPETLLTYNVEGWFRKPGNLSKLNAGCQAAIASGRAILVTESAYIADGVITFYGSDEFDGQLDTPLKVTKAVTLDPSLDTEVKDDGTVTFNRRTYIAFKSAKKFPGVGTLGSDGEWEDATDLLKSAY